MLALVSCAGLLVSSAFVKGIFDAHSRDNWLLKDMVFYTDKYSIKAPNVVVHHVENSSDISRIGKDLERTVEARKDEVVLTGMGVKGPVRLVWRKRK